MPYIDLGPAPTEGSLAQETGFVDLGPAPMQELEPTQKLKVVKKFLTATRDQVRAESQSLDRFKIQRLMGLNPNLSPEQAEEAAIGLTSSKMDTLVDLSKRVEADKGLVDLQAKLSMHAAYESTGTKEEKEQAADRAFTDTMESVIRQSQAKLWAIADAEIMQKDRQALKGEFLAKTARRWDRGIVNTIGGGLHFMDTLTRIAGDDRDYGGWAAEARTYHELLQSPTFQPVVENAFDKYFGAGVETAPFMIATMIPHVVSGGTTAALGSFLVAFGIEGNNTYQSALDRGVPEREARIRGFTVGIFNGTIEMAGGSGGKFLKQSVARKVTSKLAKAKVVTKEFAKNALKEGFLEELPQEFISMTAGGDVPRNPDGTIDWSAAFDQAWDAAITGTILGGAMGVPGSVSTAMDTKVTKETDVGPKPIPPISELVIGEVGEKGTKTDEMPPITDILRDKRQKDTLLVNVPTTARFIDTVVGKVPVTPAKEKVESATKKTMSFGEWKESKNPFFYGKTMEEEYEGKDLQKEYNTYVSSKKSIDVEHQRQLKLAEVAENIQNQPPALENIQNPTPIQISVADRNIKLRIAHQIAKKMGMKGEEFEVYKQTYGEQSSMSDMSDDQLDALISQLQIDGTAAGLTAVDVEVKMTPTEELLKQAKSSRQYKHQTEMQLRKRGAVRKEVDWLASKWHGFWASQDRVRNICRVLDNYEDGGPAQRLIWGTIKKIRTRKERVWNDMMREKQKAWAEQGVNVAEMMDVKREDIAMTRDGEGLPITAAERIYLYLATKDKKNLKKQSAWFEANNIDAKKTFDAIIKSVESNKQEKFVADSIAAYFAKRAPDFFAAAEAMGIKGVVREKNYLPIVAKDADVISEGDLVDIYQEHFEKQLQVPGKQLTKKRVGGSEKTEWDIFRVFSKVSNKIESFIEVGPVAQQVYKMVSDKKLRQAIDDATFGKGSEIIDKWIRDSARGSSTYNATELDKIIAGLRTNAVQYTLGLKIFTSAPKAALSFINGMASEPALIPYVLGVLLEYRSPSGFKRVQEEVYSKSDVMANRNPIRDIRTMWNDKTIKKFFAGKNISPFNLRYWTHTDAGTANAVWLGAYRRAKSQNMGEVDAINYADTRAQESQPMASVEDLPDIFRGSELGKTLTTFMGFLNTTQQYLKHDIVGEYRAGKISGQKALYRFTMSEILPSILLGVIVRGRLPETPREMIEDLISYIMSPAIFLGRFLFNAGQMALDAALDTKSKSYDPVESGISLIPLRSFEELVKLGVAVGKGESGADIVEKLASTIGAATGVIPEQAVISARGAYDLAIGESDDWRRLMRTKGNIKYNAPTDDTLKPGARRRSSGQRRTSQSRSRRSRSQN